MEVMEAIQKRRSIKPEKMKPDPLDRALIEQLLEAANWAPSHRLTEPWRFIVFTGDARQSLADAICETMRGEDDPVIAATDPRRKKIEHKLQCAPAAIAIICAPSDKPKVELHEEIASTAIAGQNMHLAARGLGLAGFWSSGAKAFHPKMAAFLGIAPPARCLGFFYVGWPAVQWPQGARRSVAEKVQWRDASPT